MPQRTPSLAARLKYFLLVLLVLVVLAGLAAGIRHYRRKSAPSTQSPITMAVIKSGDISRSVTAGGKLSPLFVVEVGSQISGLVTEMNVDFNTPVNKGQVLARIDSSTYEQKLRQAQADFAAARDSGELARLDAARIKTLREKDLVTQQEYDRIALALRQAETALLAREAAVENAKLDLERCTITSPIDGVVIFKQAEVGKTLQASFNTPTLCVIAQDLAKMQIIAEVSEVDVTLVKAGQDVTFTADAFPGRSFHGRIRQVRNPYTPAENSPQPRAGGGQGAAPVSYSAIIELDNPDLLLRPGMSATISIVVQHRANVLQLPNAALRVRLPVSAVGGAPAPTTRPPAIVAPAETTGTVYRLPSGDRTAAPEAVQVSLGITDNFVTEVLVGLKEGDTVITSFNPTGNP